MLIRFHEDVPEYQALTQSFLLEDEAENNLMLGLLPKIASGVFEDFWLASVNRDGRVVGCALQTQPHWVLLTSCPATGITALVSELTRRTTSVPGVIGPTAACETFAESWCWETRATSSLFLAQGIYQLDQVEPPSNSPSGRMRTVAGSDVDQVVQWHKAFHEEVGIPTSRDGHEVAREHVENETLLVWEHAGEVVSMAGFDGPTPNGIRVNFVYTPPKYRGRGYASACVAALSQRLLNYGHEFCFLYTDLSNPTSNAIYRAIGYRKVSESVVLSFEYL
jgi:uncharacterized protein